MSTFKNPVGPQSPRTYWRRRLAVALGLLAVILVIVLIVVQPGSDRTAADGTDSSATSDAPASTQSAVPSSDTVCETSAISVTAVTDAPEYSAEQQPLLSLSITNTGTSACTFPAGTDVQEYVISSGEERIWSSKDCQTGATPLDQVLEPGVAVTTTPFAWNRTRSDAAACDAERTAVIAGGATYRLETSVNGVLSADSARFILN